MLNLGVSLYSFQDDVRRRGLTLHDILKKCHEIGVKGIEIVPEQSLTYEQFEGTDRNFIPQWKDWMAEYGMTPTNMNLYDDLWLYPSRPLTEPERLQRLQRGCQLAKDLGFRSVRVSVDYGYPNTPHLENSIRICEEYGVIATLEIHAPYSLKSNWAQAWFELIDKTGSDYAGIHPDGGIFDVSPRVHAVENALKKGAKPEIIEMIQEEYPKIVARRYAEKEILQLAGDYRKTFGYGEEELREKIFAMGGGAAEAWLIGRFSCDDPAWIVEYGKYVKHFHGKFYDLVPDGSGSWDEPSINYRGIVESLVKMDYPFWISTEYEGQMEYNDPDSDEHAPDGEIIVAQHHSMVRKYEKIAREKLGK